MTGVPADTTEGKSTLQGIQPITFQPNTPMSMEEHTRNPVTLPTLFQPFITQISTSVQPKRNFYNGPTDWATWASRQFNFS